MKNIIKLGTRDSPLALWQANKVQELLQTHHLEAEIVAVKSEGDLDLVTPLYAMGVQGVFTKTLDAHLLSGNIDIAVHSLKDVPVQLAQGLRIAAVLERGAVHDLIMWKENSISNNELKMSSFTIGTGSIRRKSQWLHRYPNHCVENLRGNVQTRIRKLQESNWIGAIFAAAGLERMKLDDAYCERLDWMIPAPAQGAIVVVCRKDDETTYEQIQQIHHVPTALCVEAEREFLNALHGGCSAPIGAHMYLENGDYYFKGCVCSLDGQEMIQIKEKIEESVEGIGGKMAELMYQNGAQKIIDDIRNTK